MSAVVFRAPDPTDRRNRRSHEATLIRVDCIDVAHRLSAAPARPPCSAAGQAQYLQFTRRSAQDQIRHLTSEQRRFLTSVHTTVNTDCGAQFSATEFTDAVLSQGCQLSMDGRGAWRDDDFVERLWRSAKYEGVYLKAYDGVYDARADIADCIDWYDAGRADSSLADITPDEHYFAHLPSMAMAA